MIWESLIIEMGRTLQNPRQMARRIIAANLAPDTAWSALLLVGVLSAAFGYLGVLIMPPENDPLLFDLINTPWKSAVVQVGVQTLTAVLLWQVGRFFGGAGSLTNAAALAAWLAVPMIALQLLQLATVFLLPLLAFFASIAAVGLNFWLLTLFACELHGFRSAWRVFSAILGVSLLIGLVIAITLASLGIPGAISNV